METAGERVASKAPAKLALGPIGGRKKKCALPECAPSETTAVGRLLRGAGLEGLVQASTGTNARATTARDRNMMISPYRENDRAATFLHKGGGVRSMGGSARPGGKNVEMK